MSKNCLELWPKLHKADRELKQKGISWVSLEHWVEYHSEEILGRYVSAETVPFLSVEDMRKCVSLYNGRWHGALTKIIDESQNKAE